MVVRRSVAQRRYEVVRAGFRHRLELHHVEHAAVRPHDYLRRRQSS
jgi:hypothetical protein